MIRQVLMGVGDCSVKLKRDAPQSIKDSVREHDHIIVTAGRLADTAITATTLKAQALHNFRIDRIRKGQWEFSGPTVAAWIGDGDRPGKGPMIGLASGGRTLAQLITDCSFPLNGISVGTAHSSPATSVTQAISDQRTPRDLITQWCDIVLAEYRVNAACTLDYGSIGSTLFKYGGNIDLMLTRGADGRDVDGMNGLPVTDWDVELDASDFINGSFLWDVSPAALGGYSISTGGAAGGTGGQIAVFEDDIPTGSLSDRAAALIAQGVTQQRVSCTIDPDTYNVAGYFTAGQPGDWVYAYDDETGIRDSTIQVPYRGKSLPARSDLRVVEMTTPVQSGMGVYHYATGYDRAASAAGSGDITDWSHLVEFETSPARLELGKIRPSFGGIRAALFGKTYMHVKQ